MGDLSSEPSMEDILSSIKRIIAEEGDATPGRGRRAGRAAPPMPSEDEVLELSNPMPKPIIERRPTDAIRAEPLQTVDHLSPPATETSGVEPTAAPDTGEIDRQPERGATAGSPTSAASDAPCDTIVSSGTVDATRGALDQLSRLLVKPEPRADGTLEGMVRDMLRPMLRDWLDAQLPALAREMVAREIERITSSRR